LKKIVPADPEENLEGHVTKDLAQVRNHEAEGWMWLIDKDGNIHFRSQMIPVTRRCFFLDGNPINLCYMQRMAEI